MRYAGLRGITASIALCSAAFIACVGEVPATSSVDPGVGDSAPPGAGADGGTGGGADGGTESGLAPDAAPSLGCPLGCLPPAPTGWTGPSAVYDGPEGTKPADCPAPYTQREVDAHQGLTAAPAQCACGTPVLQGQRCSAVVEWFNSSACPGAGIALGTATSGGLCLSDTMNGGFVKVNTPTPNQGTCTFPTPPPPTLPPPSFGTLDLACGLPQAATCESNAACVRTPVPAAPFTRLCIHQEGDALCPNADFAQRFVSFRSVKEERTCDPCTGTTSGGTCGNQWGFSSSANVCQQAVSPTTNTVGACVGNSSPTFVNVNSMGPMGVTCTATVGAAKGAATSTDPVTFCCNK